MLKNLLKKKDGFTIVEVMIVLAIAGLIILVVFLAVPALQRNSRNTQRSTDAGQVGAAVNECLNNRNGQAASCDSNAELTPFIDETKLRQITTIGVGGTFPANNTTINVHHGYRCSPTGDAVGAAQARAAVLLYNVEGADTPNLPRCQEV